MSQHIEKEQIAQLKFAKEAINSEDQRKALLVLIEKATILGNAFHNKVKIFFQANDGSKRVETTVWAFTADGICLKAGTFIPLRSIQHIELI